MTRWRSDTWPRAGRLSASIPVPGGRHTGAFGVGWGRGYAAATVAAALLGLLSCAGAGVSSRPAIPADDSAAWLLPAGAFGSQYLFRLRYGGPEGSGNVRLVLRLASEKRFQLHAADTLGRSLWSLEVRGETIRLLDHRRRTVCVGGHELAINELALSPFDLNTLPALLLGRLPVAPARIQRQSPSSLDFIDGAGRRWTARVAATGPLAWTLWRGDEPIIWWTRQAKGGILSHREGSQFRWGRTVKEPLRGGLPDLQLPDAYRRVPCRESDLPQLREDQPAPPGDGSPR